MKLHCESIGAGPDVVLVHGWGWHGGVWDDAAQQLARTHRVWMPDLPGHGRSRDVQNEFDIDGLTQAVCHGVPPAATWIGWSLGGLVALAAAQYGKVRRMMLIGTTPCFLQQPGWDCALSRSWFDDFSQTLVRDVERGLDRFASLHLQSPSVIPAQAGIQSFPDKMDSRVRGNDESQSIQHASGARALLRRLRSERGRCDPPPLPALRSGLRVLEQTDLRAALPAIATPALVWHGAGDQIAAPAAAAYLAQRLPQARLISVPGAGHAPFLSHPESFMETVGAFLRE